MPPTVPAGTPSASSVPAYFFTTSRNSTTVSPPRCRRWRSLRARPRRGGGHARSFQRGALDRGLGSRRHESEGGREQTGADLTEPVGHERSGHGGVLPAGFGDPKGDRLPGGHSDRAQIRASAGRPGAIVELG